jgi:copper chaperone CopZ
MKHLILILTASLLLFACSNEKSPQEILANTNSSFVIEGMTCEEMCAKRIEDKIARTAGVKDCTVDFENNRATLSYDNKTADIETIVSMVEEMADNKYSIKDLQTETISSSNGDINSTESNETNQILSGSNFEMPNLLEYFRNII